MGEPTTQRIPWWPLPVLMAASFLVFWSVLALTPFSDDHSAVWNAGVRGIPWRNGFFRPLADLSFRLGDALAGTSAMGHRSFNVALHGLNAFLLFTLWFRTAIKLDPHERLVGAIIAGVLFLLYPFHLESIVWLVGREASLGTCFVLLGLWVAGSSLAIPYRMLGLGLSLLLGCLCYESALLLLPLALFIAWRGAVFNWPTNPRQVLLALLTAALVFTLLRSTVVPPGEDSYLMGFFDDGLTGVVVHAPKAAVRLLLPPDADHWHQLTKGVILLIAGVVVALLLRPGLNRATGSKDQLIMWTGLLVISFVIPTVAGVSTTTSEGDRFLYMPSAFLCGLVASLLIGIRQRIVRYLLLSLVVLASAIGLQRAQANWKEASRITQRILDALPPTPSNGRLFVGGLPDSYQGAFIFRNGSPEAVDLIGGRGSRMVVVNDDQLAKPGPIHFRGQAISPTSDDRWIVWDGNSFQPLTLPPRNSAAP